MSYKEMFLSSPSVFDRRNTLRLFHEMLLLLIAFSTTKEFQSSPRLVEISAANITNLLHIKTKLSAWIEVTEHVITAEIHLLRK